MVPFKPLLIALALLMPLAAPVSAHAAPLRVAAGAALTLEQAVAKVRRDTGGRILAAETVQDNGRRVHVIKVLTPDHSVRTVRIDAGNGR